MKIIPNFSSFLIVAVLLLVSCQRESIVPQFEFPFDNLQDFLASNNFPEKFIVSPDQDISITASGGTVLAIREWMIPDGTGDITISIKEYLNRKDLILGNLSTEATGDRLLESGGSFYIDIRDQNEDKVDLNGQISLTFPIPSNVNSPQEMTVWKGEENTEEFTEWTEVPESVESTITIDSSYTFFTLYSPDYYYINCDDVVSIAGLTTQISVSLADKNPDWYNTRVSIVGKNINTISNLSMQQDSYRSIDYAIGEEVYVVAMHIEDGLFYALEEVTIDQNMHLELNLIETDQDELDQALDIFK